VFWKNKLLEKEQLKYNELAKDYLDNQQKTEGLLTKAIRKASKRKSALGITWNKLQLLFDLIKAYSKGEYRKVSNGTMLTIIGAILYFVSPIDLIPDFIVGLGIVDDAAVLSFALKKISRELDEFENWKNAVLFKSEPHFD